MDATDMAITPTTAKTPTESSLDRFQAGPEQGNTSVSVTQAKMPDDKMDATPPIQSAWC